MGHTFESAAPQIEKLRELRNELHDADGPLASGHDFQICVGGPVRSKDDVKRWEDLGVTRLVIAPWSPLARGRRGDDPLRGAGRAHAPLGVARARSDAPGVSRSSASGCSPKSRIEPRLRNATGMISGCIE